MTGAGAQRICALRLPGSSRARFVDAGQVEIDLGDWVAVNLGYGDEPGQIVVAPDQWVEPVTMEDTPAILYRLTDDDIDLIAGNIERSRGLIPAAADVIRDTVPGCFLTGLRLTLSGDRLIVVYRGNAPEDAQALIDELSRVLGLPAHLEQDEPGTADDGLLGGSTTVTSRTQAQTFRELLESRLDVLREPDTATPHGMPRLDSRVQTPSGDGKLVAIDIRHWRATVQLDDGDEIILGVDELGPA